MTRPVTDEELTDVREAAVDDDWCVLCLGSDPNTKSKLGLCRCETYVSIRSILARIDAAEGRR